MLPEDVGGGKGEKGGELGHHPGEGDVRHICVVVGAANLF